MMKIDSDHEANEDPLDPPYMSKNAKKIAILSTFLESGGKKHPQVEVRREKFNIGNCPQIFFRASYICWELAI